MTIEILIADDRCLIVEAIKAVLEREPEIKIVGTAVNGRAAIALAQQLRPDIILIDIEMPIMNGITATKYISKHLPNTKIIVLTSHNSQKYLDRAFMAGASGYLLKESLIQDLKQAIYSLDRGNFYIDAKLSTQAINKIQKTKIVKYQQKTTYLKKYQKSIYIPSPRNSRQNIDSKNISALKSDCSNLSNGITKANLAAIFEPSLLSDRVPPSYNKVPRKELYRKRNLKKVAWLLVAIASLVLSLIIF